MIGRFTTMKYDARGRLYEELVSYNDFTNPGYEWMWRRMAGQTPDSLDSATIVVGNGAGVFTGGETQLQGDQVASMPVDDGFPLVVGSKITFQATFGEREGAFDWMERGIVTPSGVLIDRAVGDQGRKVLGAVWVVQAELELARS